MWEKEKGLFKQQEIINSVQRQVVVTSLKKHTQQFFEQKREMVRERG